MFFFMCPLLSLLALLAYAQCTLQQRFFTLSQHQKKLFQIPLRSIYRCQNSFFHCLKLDLIKMAKLACDQLCYRTLRIRQKIASAHCAYGNTLLAHTAHMEAKCQCTLRMRQQNHVKLCSLQAYAAQAVALCQRTLRLRQQIASGCFAYGSNLKAYAAHTVAICQRTLRIR